MDFKIGDKVLVTTDNWFHAPDGNTYRAVFGTVKGVHDVKGVLGITPNDRSMNWFLNIGNMIIAGCQIHYAVKCDKCSSSGGLGWSSDAENGLKSYQTPNSIYFADPPEETKE